ncbi:MAG: hypothetical protein LAT51_07895 [Flavobacteriaceae bacterium]|nr:hypothetical protein [Flavobacteriaceae bacterium]
MVVIDNNFAYLENNPDFKLSFKNDELVVISREFDGFANEYEDIFNTNETVVLKMLLNELIPPKDNKFLVIEPIDGGDEEYEPLPDNGNQIETCSYMGTVTSYYFRDTRSAAVAQATYAKSHAEALFEYLSDNPGQGNACEPFGEIDSSCLYGDHYCVASYQVCCD